MSEDQEVSLVTTGNSEKSLTLPPDAAVDSTLKEVKALDLQIANDMLKAAYVGFGSVKSISGLCKLIDTTLNAVERRRKILCMQYGATNQVSKTPDFDPLD